MRASVYGALGDRDAAFRWLDIAFRARASTLMYLDEFNFDPIRDDPRFKALEARIAAAKNKAP